MKFYYLPHTITEFELRKMPIKMCCGLYYLNSAILVTMRQKTIAIVLIISNP